MLLRKNFSFALVFAIVFCFSAAFFVRAQEAPTICESDDTNFQYYLGILERFGMGLSEAVVVDGAPDKALCNEIRTAAKKHRDALRQFWGDCFKRWSQRLKIRFVYNPYYANEVRVVNSVMAKISFTSNLSNRKFFLEETLKQGIMQYMASNYFGDTVPRWINDGMACQVGSPLIKNTYKELAEQYAKGGGFLTLVQLLANDCSAMPDSSTTISNCGMEREDQTAQFKRFSQSCALVKFLTRDSLCGRTQFLSFVKNYMSIARGNYTKIDDFNKALAATYKDEKGQPIFKGADDFQNKLKEWILAGMPQLDANFKALPSFPAQCNPNNSKEALAIPEAKPDITLMYLYRKDSVPLLVRTEQRQQISIANKTIEKKIKKEELKIYYDSYEDKIESYPPMVREYGLKEDFVIIYKRAGQPQIVKTERQSAEQIVSMVKFLAK